MKYDWAMDPSPSEGGRKAARTALVLSAGGLRGAAHLGVLRQLVARGVDLDAIVGVSAGAIVAAYYAAVGLSLDELIRDAEIFRGRHLLAHSLNVQSRYRLESRLAPWCGVIPERLRQLESASFDRLHHGVKELGIVCHDVRAGRPRYFTGKINRGPSVADLAKASASIPFLFPAVPVLCEGAEWLLADGGVSDSLPVRFAREVIGATHVIVSDCRWLGGRALPEEPNLVWIRPRLSQFSLWSPKRGLMASIEAGEAAVTSDILAGIRNPTPIAFASP